MACACLEVLAHLNADLPRSGEGPVSVDSTHEEAAHDGKVERIEGGFEGDDAQVCLFCVLGQIHCAYGGCSDVQQLSVGSLVCCLHPRQTILSAQAFQLVSSGTLKLLW